MSTAGDTSRAQQTCSAQTRQGAACRAFALEGGLCAVHSPERAAEVQAARSKGGKVRALQKRRRRLDSPGALVHFTGQLIHDALEGVRGVDVVRTALYGVNLQRQLIESSDMEARLAAVEQALAQAQGRQMRRAG